MESEKKHKQSEARKAFFQGHTKDISRTFLNSCSALIIATLIVMWIIMKLYIKKYLWFCTVRFMGSPRSICRLFRVCRFLSSKQTHVLHLDKLWPLSAHEIYASHCTGESSLNLTGGHPWEGSLMPHDMQMCDEALGERSLPGWQL